MSLPSLSIRRPVTLTMIIMACFLLGVTSLFQLPVELYPNTQSGEISIVIYVRGQVPPTEVEESVTKLVEDAVSTVSNLKQVLSVSKEGESTVVLTFEPGTDMDFAALEVREKFSRIKNDLPKEIEKPIIAQFKQSDKPVVVFSATSHLRTSEEVRRIVDESVKERFKRINGVANVEVYGGRERKVLVEIDQQKRVAYGVTMEQITGTLSSNNLNLLSGEIERSEDKLLIRMIGEFDNIGQIQNLGIKATEYGSILRLSDIATVKDGYLDPKGYARYNAKDVVSIYIQKETTENTIRVARAIVAEADVIREKLPVDIKMVATSNQSTFIEKAIENLKGSLLQGSVIIFLVFLVFLFRLNFVYAMGVIGLMVATIFLKNIALYVFFAGLLALILARASLRSVIIVTLSIPISVITTFLFMRFMGFSLNVMTLIGLALGVGLLVDNSIVVFDNILKKRERGIGNPKAVIEGSQELLLAIVASTITTVIVFLPLIFLSKEIQMLYQSMAMTVIISLVISLFCALTIVPLVASRDFFQKSIVRVSSDAHKHWIKAVFPKQKKVLFKLIRYPWAVILACLIFSGLAIWQYQSIPREFIGSTEQNKFTIFIEMPSGTKLEVSNETVKKVEKLIEAVPELKSVTSRVEAWSSKVYVELVPLTERKRSIKAVIETLRPHTSRMQPAFIYYEEEQQVGTKEINLEIFGHDYKILRQLAMGIANRMDQIEGLEDMKIRMREGRPEMQVRVDKNRASDFNVTTQAIADQVHGSMRGLRATLFREEGKEVETITRLQEKYRKTFRDLHKIVLSDPQGNPLLLEQVSHFRFDLGPSEIWRKNKDRMIQVSGSLGDIPLSEAVEMVRESLNDLEFPEDYYYRVGGDYEKLVNSSREQTYALCMVVFLIYIVLASFFESFSEPLLIMIAIPLALGGAIAALKLGQHNLGIGAALGMMLLSGVVVNHSIILVDCINHYRREKKCVPARAVILATRDRLRPIVLTTATTVLAFLPMAIDKTEGSSLWSPLASAVIGGLISSMILTLMVTPTFYLTFINSGFWIRSIFRRFFVKPRSELPRHTTQV